MDFKKKVGLISAIYTRSFSTVFDAGSLEIDLLWGIEKQTLFEIIKIRR
jgi:hypothetical protein